MQTETTATDKRTLAERISAALYIFATSDRERPEYGISADTWRDAVLFAQVEIAKRNRRAMA